MKEGEKRIGKKIEDILKKVRGVVKVEEIRKIGTGGKKERW